MTKALLVAVVLAACGGGETGEVVDPAGTYAMSTNNATFTAYFVGHDLSIAANEAVFELEDGAQSVSMTADCNEDGCVLTAAEGESMLLVAEDAAGPLGYYALTEIAIVIGGPEGPCGSVTFDYQCLEWFDNTQCSGSVELTLGCQSN